METFWTNHLNARLSYARQEVEDRTTHKTLSDSPAHLVKLNLTVPVMPDKLFANLESQYTSERLMLTPLARPIVDPHAGAFGVLNFTLFSHNLVKGLDLSAGVYNLLDKKYSDPATPFHQQDLIAQNGRTFRVKLTYRF
ncbi:MAG: TonB-dependent receptor [Pedosphaera sp.]|nr:TonB-dependent receptor [Pedosphaera sp.]